MPADTLEQALIAASEDAEARPRFYQLLLESQVFVIGHGDDGQDGKAVLQEGERISIAHWGRQDGSPIVPMFSRLELLQQAVQEPVRYLRLPVRDLLALVSGSDFVLNPMSAHSKELVPDEVTALLAGQLGTHQERVMSADMEVRLGQPEHMPELFLNELRKAFLDEKGVNRAWFCLMLEPGQEQPSFLIGVEASGDFGALIQRLGPLAVEHAPDGVPVDLMPVEPGEPGPSAYFLQDVTPFYDRGQIRTRLKGLFKWDR